jgi:hypothetical protein
LSFSEPRWYAPSKPPNRCLTNSLPSTTRAAEPDVEDGTSASTSMSDGELASQGAHARAAALSAKKRHDCQAGCPKPGGPEIDSGLPLEVPILEVPVRHSYSAHALARAEFREFVVEVDVPSAAYTNNLAVSAKDIDGCRLANGVHYLA